MAQMTGADADALDALARRFEQAAQQLEQSGQHLRSQLHSSPWKGGDAEGFRNEWDTSHARTIAATAGFLREGSERLRRNADEQRRASNGDGGAFGPGGGWPGWPGFPGFPFLPGFGQDPGFWDHFLAGDYGLELQWALYLVETLAEAGGLLSHVVGGPLGILSGGVQLVLGIHDLFNPEYEGFHNYLEGFGDVAGIIGAGGAIVAGVGLTAVAIGAVATAPAWVPVAAGVAIVGGAVALAVDTGLEAWHEWGGREWWYGEAAPAIDRAWDDTTAFVDRTWDQAWEAGSDALDRGADALADFGSDLVGGAKKLIPGW